MAKSRKKVTTVHEHLRHVPISKKNPDGTTVVDQHLRRLPGTYLDSTEIEYIFEKYNRTNLIYPASKKLKDYKDADKYDDIIAVWTDYFNKKFDTKSSMDPDMIKALIASESGFRINTPRNKRAIGLAQITKETLKTMQDPNGEVKDFIFNKIRQKDLTNPAIAIPMSIRWLFRKKALAEYKLKREPTHEEIILEYKGLLKSSTKWKDNALESYRKNYAFLKK